MRAFSTKILILPENLENMSKANSGDDHIECGGVSQASSGHDVTRDRDLAAKPESQSQNDHTNGGV